MGRKQERNTDFFIITSLKNFCLKNPFLRQFYEQKEACQLKGKKLKSAVLKNNEN